MPDPSKWQFNNNNKNPLEKTIVFCKPVEMSHIEKELDECAAGGRREELLGRNRSTFLLVMSCQVGRAVLFNCTLSAPQEVGAFA